MSDIIQTEKNITEDSNTLSLSETLINSRTLESREIDSLVDVTTTIDLFPSEVIATNTDGEQSVITLDDPTSISFTSFTPENRDNFVKTIDKQSKAVILPIEPYQTNSGTAHFACTDTVPTIKVTFEDQTKMKHTISIQCVSSEDAEIISEKLTTGSLELVSSENKTKLRHVSPIHSQVNIPFSFSGGILFSILATPIMSPSQSAVSSVSAVTGLYCLFVGFLITAMISIFVSDLQGKYQRDYIVSLTHNESNLENYCTDNTVYTSCTITPEFDGENLTLRCPDIQKRSDIWEFAVGSNRTFSNTSVTEFYMNLGFEHSEKSDRPFEAYISPIKFENQPYLESKQENLYLYPEPPLNKNS